MEISFHKFYILVVSEQAADFFAWIVRLDGKGKNKKAMGFAIPPCIIVLRNLTHPMTQQWINHERIHISQYFTTLGLSFVFSKFEYLYARIFLKYSHIDAYSYECQEQEAYLNQHNLEYLKTRSFFAVWKYVKNKKKFHTNENYRLIIDK